MPELPEVETVRQVLRRKILNKKINGIDILYNKIIKTDLDAFKNNIINQTINEVDRYGKYLLIKLDDYYLISHLRMEGKYFYRKIDSKRDKHDHIIFKFTDDTELVYNDVRKFGTMNLKSIAEVYTGEPLGKIGLEPFSKDFNLAYLKQKLNKKRPIKSALLDQTIVAGLGNIYVDEVLFLSGIHPETISELLDDEDIVKIINSSVDVLNRAITLGGTTIRSYYSDEKITGRFQNELAVHQKKGEKCPDCGEIIIKTKVGGRGTYYCPNCQIRLTKK